GFEVVAAFDANPDATRSRGVMVPVFPDSDLEKFIGENSVKLAILCVPVEFAQAVVNRLVIAGILGILNFSPIVLEVSPDVTVNNVDLALELEHLSYFIR
ncbi:MAG: redox-sensing transcriptional repressor Rex, partial [Luteolibacter sp.]